MEIQEILNKANWEVGLAKFEQVSFLQSWDWGEFQRSVGHDVKRYLISTEKIPVQIIVHQLRFGLVYWYVPYTIASGEILEKLKMEAQKQGVVFIRVESARENFGQLPPAVISVNHRQPSTTLVIDLTQSLATIRSAMHQKTRYNIGLAERKGVTVVWKKDPQIFSQLMSETSQRDQFKAHQDNYYAKLIASPLAEQSIAYFEGKPIASGIFIFYKQRFIYLHGASSNSQRDLMAPYSIQWEAIKHAQELGAQLYDFWGIAPPVSSTDNAATEEFHNLTWPKNHPWSGVTRFKAGFDGIVEHSGSAFEIPVNKFKYKIFRFIKKFI